MGGYRAVLLLAWLAICVTVPVSTLGMNEITTKEDIAQLVNLINEKGTSSCEQDQMYKMVEKNFNSLNDKIDVLEYQLCQHMRGNNQCDVTNPHPDDGQGSTTPAITTPAITTPATTTPTTTTPTTTTPPPTFECSQAVRSGVYTIGAGNSSNFKAYCLVNGGKKWTVIQRRTNGRVSFARGWAAYKQGFGNVAGEFWLGNEYIHKLTAAGLTRLRIVLEDWDNIKRPVEYSTFRVAGEGEKYKLTVSGFSGSNPPGDAFSYHTGMEFTTTNSDNDKHNLNCAALYGRGGWWFNHCGRCSLNGVYKGPGVTGIYWYHLRTWNSLKAATMMLSTP